MSAPERREGRYGGPRAIGLCVLAFVAARAVLVLSVADVFGFGEELAKGAAAKAMLDGLGVAHYRLAYVYHEGGGFAVTHLKALLFLLVGPSVLAHKLAALLTSALVLAAALSCAARHLNRPPLGLITAAFVLAPASMQRASLLSLGTHFEALLFVVLVLHFTLRIAARPRGEPCRRRDLWMLGLASGFGLYFSPLVAPALAVAGVALPLRGRLGARDGLRILLGFLLGALPLWIMLALAGTAALLVRGEVEAARAPLSLGASLVSLAAPIAVSRDPGVWAAAAATLALSVVSLRRIPRATSAVVLGYLGCYALAYVASGLAVRYDPENWMLQLRLAPCWLFGTLLAADGCTELWRRGGAARVLGAAAFGLILAHGARAGAQLVLGGRPAHPVENLKVLAGVRGYSYREYFGGLRLHLEGALDQRAAVMLRLQDDPRLVVPAVAERLYQKGWMLAPDDVAQNARRSFGERADLALLGCGQVLHGGWKLDFPAAFERLQAQPSAARAPLAEALGRTGLRLRFGVDELDRLVQVPVPAEWEEAFLAGVGWRVQQTYRLRPDLARGWIEAQAETHRPALRAGYERARAEDTL